MLPLALLAALSAPAQADGLSLTGVRLSHGVLGPERADGKLLPGDSLIVSFDIDGITVDAQGKVRYSLATECVDGAGKTQFKQPPRELEAINVLGGARLPAFARVDTGLQQPPGEYTLTVTVVDLASKNSKSLTQKFTILPKAFGVVRLHLSSDKEGEYSPGLLSVGQAVWLNGLAVGFERDPMTKAPKIALELTIRDEMGKATLPKPFSATLEPKDLPSTATSVPLQFLASLSRPGKFTVEIKAKDVVSGKSFATTFPLHVHPR
jgi:hypothetical protein